MSRLSNEIFCDDFFNSKRLGDGVDDLVHLVTLLAGFHAGLQGIAEDKRQPSKGQQQGQPDP